MRARDCFLWTRYRVGIIGGHSTLAAPLLARRRNHGPSTLVVNKTCELVMEGYPRSANTFAYTAFTRAQPRPMQISHHTHAPAQIVLGARRHIPTVALIRKPPAPVLSNVQFLPFLSPARALSDWIKFYERIRPVATQVLFVTFEEATTDMGAVTARINERFGTDFGLFDHNDENVASVQHQIEDWHGTLFSQTVFEATVPRPSTDRTARSEVLLSALDTPKGRRLLARAHALYDELVDGPRRPVPAV